MVVDDSARSAAAARILLTEYRAADPTRMHNYALRYDGGQYLVIRREPAQEAT